VEKWDPTVVVALVSVIGIAISGAFGVLVAVITNRKEKSDAAARAAERAAEKATTEMEEALRERITLRDEQIAQLKLTIVDLEATIERLRRRQRDLP